MEKAVIHFIILGVISGLSKGAGVLPDGPLNAAVGGTMMFTTTLTPQEKPFTTIAWTFGSRNIITFNNNVNTTGSEYEGRMTLFMSTGSLVLRNLACNDSGEYTVSIFPQTGGIQQGSTTLKVDGPVSNVMVTASSTDLVEFISSVSLSCSASGCPLSFLWLDGSTEVTTSDRLQLTDGGATLTIVNVTRYDQERFRCHVSNPFNSGTSDPVNLSISYGPENVTFKISPSQEYYESGSDITLSCSAVSKPSALYYWFLNGSKVSHTGSEINIQISESGNYGCQAFNQKTLRYDTSSPLAVTVLERISGVSVTPTNLPIEGKSVNLTCDAAAGSIFTRMWMKDDSNLILTDNITLHDENKVLLFKSLNKADNGEYSCKISNPVSSDGATYVMVINSKPGKTSSCSSGCIAGIVIACLVILGGAAGGGYYVYNKKVNNKAPPQSGQKEVEEHVYEDI